MVAVSITKNGVEFDLLANVAVHPAAELFPLLQGAEFADLVADIAANGQRDPVVMTPDGQLLDGRSRWRACAKLGITPVTRVERSEPWAYVISANQHRRHLTDAQRAMIGARIAERPPGSNQYGPVQTEVPLPPTQAEAARLLNISSSSITRAREVARDGTKALQRLVDAGKLPIYTAARVARLEPERQDEFAERVCNGADPKKLARVLDAPSNWRPRETAATDNRSPRRHRHLTVPALSHLLHSLETLDLVLRSVDGLDPAITDEEAARWLGDLFKGRTAFRRVLALLTERKESIS